MWEAVKDTSRRAAARLALAGAALALCSGCGLQVSVTAAPSPAPPGKDITYTVTVTNVAGCTLGPPLGFAIFVAPQGQIPPLACGLFSGGIPSGLVLPPNAGQMEAHLEALMTAAPSTGIMCEQPTEPDQPILCVLNATLAPDQSLQTAISGPLLLSGKLTALTIALANAPDTGCNSNVTSTIVAGTGCTSLVGEPSAPLLSNRGRLALVIILAAVGGLAVRRQHA